MLDARTGRTRVTTAALPWATRPGARAGRERRSAAEPCLLWSTESSVINILPLKTHVKYRSIPPPARDYPFKLEVTFCISGLCSLLLSNIVLDELDRELERRKHRFVRYADDCNIYVRSQRAGQRVMSSVTGFLTRRLKLKVNEAKSAVARPVERKFLGFSFSSNKEPKRRIAPKALLRCKQKIRELTRRTRGISLEQMTKELA